MTIRRKVFLATTLLAIAGPTAGCFTGSKAECRAEAQQGAEVRGTLEGVESESRAAEYPYQRRVSLTTNGVEREVRRAADALHVDASTVVVSFGGVELSFRRPTALGVSPLAALEGKVCEWRGEGGETCEAVEGVVDVIAMAEPCTKDGCANFDIQLRVSAPEPAPTNAFVRGYGRLLQRRWEEPACVHVSNEEDCLFDDCFLGVEL